MKQFLAGCAVAATISGLFQATMMVNAQDTQGKQVIARAPFVVVGDQGEVLMDLTVGDNGPVLTIHGQDNERMVQLGSTGRGMAIKVGSSTRFSALESQDASTLVTSVFDGNIVLLKSAAQEQHVLIGGEEKPVVDLGVKPGTNAALRVAAPNGTIVASVGSNIANADAGAVFVGSDSGMGGAAMLVDGAGAGLVAVKIGGQDVVRLEPNVASSGGKVTVANTGGDVVFNAGLKTDGDGAACVYSLKDGQKCF